MTSRIRNRSNLNYSSTYQSLEPRNLLAATIYVDFGLGMAGDFTINDSQSDSVGGPQIFGSGQTLESFSDYLIDSDRMDINQDSMTDLDEVNQFAMLTLNALSEIYLPFDVSIELANASNFADIQSTLASTGTNDAYVFVGGSDSRFTIDDGRSVFDPMNSIDNLAFVFGNNLSYNGSSPWIINNSMNQLARSIGKQVGHTFGINSVEGGSSSSYSNEIGYTDLMARPGTDADGNRFTDKRVWSFAGFFSQADIPIMHVNGNSSGTINPFDKMAEIVGLNVNAPAYFAGTGLLDEVVITSAGDMEVDIVWNGVEYISVDISNGLFIETGRHSNTQNEDTVDISGDVTGEVFIRGANKLSMLDVAVHAEIYDVRGMLRSNITFAEINTLETGSFDDQIESIGVNSMLVETGAGEDSLILHEGSVIYGIYLGEDDDTLFSAGGYVEGIFDGGEGHDTWDFSMAPDARLFAWSSAADGSYEFGNRDFQFGIPEVYTNFEHAVGSDNGDSTISVYTPNLKRLNWYVDGPVITLQNPRTERLSSLRISMSSGQACKIGIKIIRQLFTTQFT